MDWPMHRRVERQAIRMHQMMQRLDVDAICLVRLRRGDAYAEARTRCLLCRTTEECLRWLDDSATAGTSPQFCPNLSLFRACTRATPLGAHSGRHAQASMVGR